MTSNMFICFGFLYLWNLPWYLALQLSDISSNLLNLMWRNASITLMKERPFFNLLQSGFFYSFFAGILPFQYHFNSLLFADFITQVCCEIPCSSISHFVKTSYLTFRAIQQTGCHVMQDPGVANLGTDYKQFYFNFLIYFYLPSLREFLEYVSRFFQMIFISFNKSFNLHVGNFLI